MSRDNRDLERVQEQIRSSCNPFEGEPSDKLFNIHTGKAASDEVRRSLLKVPENGKALHQPSKNVKPMQIVLNAP